MIKIDRITPTAATDNSNQVMTKNFLNVHVKRPRVCKTKRLQIHNADCLVLLRQMPNNFVDAVVTDPPYGIGFMGHSWDQKLPNIEIWQQVLRVLKPGGYLLSFGGIKTFCRLVCQLEDTGFELRDVLLWLFSDSFPKNTFVSKKIDKLVGTPSKVVGTRKTHNTPGSLVGRFNYKQHMEMTEPTSELAQRYQGFGNMLKSGYEPIVMCRKPLDGTEAANILKWGTGCLNLDAGRIKTPQNVDHAGRFPTNVVLDDSAELEAEFDRYGTRKSGMIRKGTPYRRKDGSTASVYQPPSGAIQQDSIGDSGSVSRFFYHCKVRKTERAGMQHSTIKPLALIKYWTKIVLPPTVAGQPVPVVLDPFAGTGTTGLAALQLGARCILIEQDPKHYQYCQTKLAEYLPS